MGESLRRPAPAPDPRTGLAHDIPPDAAGWRYVGFHEYRLASGQGFERPRADLETVVIVLEGAADVSLGGSTYPSLGSRDDVFEGPPAPILLIAPGTDIEVTARADTTIIVGHAPSATTQVTRLIEPASMVVETRGSGSTERRVHHLLPPAEEAGRLILFEVYTPGGNWSSYPPHKHDTEDPPNEAYLEELYYYRFARPEGFAFARVYTPDRSLDESFAPEDRDVVLVPRGYHPVGQPAGYEGYYLNIMAGPNRDWHFTFDPDHAWLADWAPTAAR